MFGGPFLTIFHKNSNEPKFPSAVNFGGMDHGWGPHGMQMMMEDVGQAPWATGPIFCQWMD